jgi:hypothetical protein
MALVLYAKIGTGPGGYIRVYRRRRPVAVGDYIKFKRCGPFGELSHDERWSKWSGGVVQEKRFVHGQILHVMERM